MQEDSEAPRPGERGARLGWHAGRRAHPEALELVADGCPVGQPGRAARGRCHVRRCSGERGYGSASRGKALALGGVVGAILAGVAPTAVNLLFQAASS